MSSTGLAIVYLTRPLLPLSPRSEQGAWAKDRPYAHGRTLHSTGWRQCKLFLFYSSFIDFYISLLCIVTLGCNIVGPAGRRKEATTRDEGEDRGRSTEDGPNVLVDAKSWCEYGSISATWAIRSSSSSSCWRHSCEYECLLLLLVLYLYIT
jgi:hypothetical protein